MQEIFIDLWSSAGKYDAGKASETTFVAMIARRRLIDKLRKTKREPVEEELTLAADLGDRDPTADLETRDEAARAARMIRALRPEQRRVIKLAVYHGYSHQSIADKLGIPLGSVKTHLRRGLLRIREGLQATGVTPGREVTT